MNLTNIFVQALATQNGVQSDTSNILKSDTVMAAVITAACSLLIFLIKFMHDNTKNKKVNSEELKLELHPYFTRMNVLKNSIHTSFVLKNKGKEAVFKDILWNYISISQEVLLEFVKTISDKNNDNIPNTEFYNLCMTAFQKMIEKQNTYFLTSSNYIDTDKEVLSKVLTKFNVWNLENTNYIQTTIELISNSIFYSTNIGKAGAILDFYTGMSVHITNTASKTLNALNGDLEGLTFKGIKL